ncbi:hypothetical protein DUNSADRAFT_3833 [Dunaliella salina]|uniref:Uncharacterized protein n=1 Tax=Dunaliella salina TaxID=3046 RepID=A0ABQ7GTB7_DUNSA|nr:hypothetical protein DUNSADRAFT_3833 [Dunaliella salina]|eukprot:KAF5837817.1 hypothetical protein DUNSADRAFT_3833 [Dunaliella salina]
MLAHQNCLKQLMQFCQLALKQHDTSSSPSTMCVMPWPQHHPHYLFLIEILARSCVRMLGWLPSFSLPCWMPDGRLLQV